MAADLAAMPAGAVHLVACRELAEVAALALPGRDWRAVAGGLLRDLLALRAAALALRHEGHWALAHAVCEAAGYLIEAAGWRVTEGELRRPKEPADAAVETARARMHMDEAR